MWTPLLLAFLAADAPPAIVVVDAEARAEGWVLEISGVVLEDALPVDVDVDEGERVHVLGPGAVDEVLSPHAGEVWEVQGAQGELVLWLVNEDVHADVVKVNGTKDAVTALAEEVGAEVVWEHETAWLAREDILFDLPWVTSGVALDVDAVVLVDANVVPPSRRSGSSRAPQLRVAVQTQALSTLKSPAVRMPLASSPTPVSVENSGPAKLQNQQALSHEPRVEQQGPKVTARMPGGELGTSAFGHPLHPPLYVGLVRCSGELITLDASGRFRVGQSCTPDDPACGGSDRQWSLTSEGRVLLLEGDAVTDRMTIDPETRRCVNQ